MLALQRISVLILAAVCVAVPGQNCAGQTGAGQQKPSSPAIYPQPISATHPSAIACMKRLPDGAAVCINRKCVTRVAADHLYIEEADRSSGVKALYDGFYPPVELEPGNLVSFSGVVGTVGRERVIWATSSFTCDLNAYAAIAPLGMTTPAILGWPIKIGRAHV